MKRLCMVSILTFSMLLSTGCTVLKTSRENNITGKLTTTVFDNRNSFEDLEINKKIEEEVKVEDGNTAEADFDFWEKIKIHFKNMKWR